MPRPSSLASPTDLDPEIVRAIGASILFASFLDYALSVHLYRLITPKGHPMQDAPLAVTLGMDVRVKLGLMRTTFRMHAPHASEEFDGLTQELGDWFDKKRNAMAHYLWRPGTKPGTADGYAYKAVSRWQKPELKGVTAAQIIEWTATAQRLAHRINEAITEAGLPTPQDLLLGAPPVP